MNLSITTVKQTAADAFALSLERVRNLRESARDLNTGGGAGGPGDRDAFGFAATPEFARRAKVVRFFQHPLRRRVVAIITTISVVYSIFIPQGAAIAQTFREFGESDRQDLERFVNRANRLSDVDAWNNYLAAGVATERVEWEEEAFDVLRKRFRDIDLTNASEADKEAERELAESEYEAALLQWQADAEDYIFEERGSFRAERAALDADLPDPAELESFVAAANAAVVNEQDLNLSLWDAVAGGVDAVRAAFEAELDADLNAARAANGGLPAAEQAAFEAALDARASELRSEFALRENFYIKRGRNQYIAVKRADDLSARLLAEQQSADAIGQAALDETQAAVDAETEELLASTEIAIDQMMSGPGFDASQLDLLTGTWEQKIEAVIDSGLRRWELAEENLYSERLAWMAETKASREQAETIWKKNHEEIKKARDAWLETVRGKINEGREAWNVKIAEFDQSRQLAEQELDQYILEERARRDAALSESGEMVRGGGAALAQAKEALRYYQARMAGASYSCPHSSANGAVWCFYREEATRLATNVANFERILGNSENLLYDAMHSGSGSSGFLNDVRNHAGDLPVVTAALGAGNYRADLETLMAGRSEDFLLYKRDIESLIDRNAVFVQRSQQLNTNTEFLSYTSLTTADQLRTLVSGLDTEFQDHKRELFALINKDRSALPDDAARLAAIKMDIQTWLAADQDANVRLKRQVGEYFAGSLDGYFVTGNENDPYLMTHAEYEWELLRRERNYLAKRLERAEAVKRYAELAERFDAGLELAQVTEERAAAAELWSKVRELRYLALKGDLNFNEADLDNEYGRLLAEKGVNLVFLDQLEASLAEEQDILADAAALANPGAGDLSTIITRIESFLANRVPESERSAHRLYELRRKFADQRAQIVNGADAGTLANRWTALQGATATLATEVGALAGQYNLPGLRTELAAFRADLGANTLIDYAQNLNNLRTQMQTHAELVREANEELETARERYRSAYIDFQVLASGDANELIRIELTNTSRELAAALNRMNVIETAAGGVERIVDGAEKERTEFLRAVSSRTRADENTAAAGNALRWLTGFEEAKKRRAATETLLSGNNLNAMNATARVDAILAVEAQILNRNASDEVLRSNASAIQAVDALRNLKSAHETKTTAIATAISGSQPAAVVEKLRAEQAELEEQIAVEIERLVASIRGEEEARKRGVFKLLGDNRAAEEALKAEIAAEEKTLAERSLTRGESAGAALQNFLSAHQGQTYAQLLAQVNANAAAQTRPLRIGAGEDGFGLGADATSARADLNAVRRWLLANQASIDYVNRVPTASDFDQRTTAEKWSGLLSSVGELADDSGFARDFEDGAPASASDAWAVAYQADRVALQARLATLLATPDGSLLAAYNAASAADRELYFRYGGVDLSSPAALRLNLEVAARNLARELSGFTRDFRAVYLRETKYAAQKSLATSGPEYQAKNSELESYRAEKSALTLEKNDLVTERAASVDAVRIARIDAQIGAIDARIAELDNRIATLTPAVAALRAQVRQNSNQLNEITKPGSTAPMLNFAAVELNYDALRLSMKRLALDYIAQQQERPEDETRKAALDQVKILMGLYKTDASGEISRDANGKGLVSPEFAAIVTDPDANLAEILGGNLTGPQLITWSGRLSAALDNPETAAKLDPEVRAAIQEIEGAITAVLIARTKVSERGATAADIRTRYSAERDRYQALAQKVALLDQFEAGLSEAISRAASQNQDAAAAALAFLEKKENQHVFHLFAGYDYEGKLDNVADPDLQARVQELLTLADRLRAAQLDRNIADLSDDYGEQLEYLEAAGNPEVATTTLDQFITARPALKSNELYNGLNGVAGDADFRKNARDWIETHPTVSPLYKSAALAVINRSQSQGDPLKQEALAAVSGLETDLRARLGVLIDRDLALYREVQNTEVTTSVADFITAYANRSASARTELDPALAAIPDATDLATAKTQITAAIDTELSAAIYGTLRGDLKRVMSGFSGTTADLKAALQARIDAEPTLNAGEQADLNKRTIARTMLAALARMSLETEYDPDNYPAELRNLILLRGYTQANERLAEYQELRNSASEAEREAASLNLAGLPAWATRSLLIEDYDTYAQAATLDAYRSTQADGATLAGYINTYLKDRNANPANLPLGAADLLERAGIAELARLSANAAGNPASLDERDYFLDFQSYILAAMAAEYRTANSITLSGATLADQRANYRTQFEQLLDSASYARGGKTIRERLISEDQINAYFEQSFAQLYYGTPLDNYLPNALAQVRLRGELGQPAKTAESYLPQDLRNIANYQTADYKAIATALGDEYLATLARVEVLNEGAVELSGLGLYLDNSEIDRVLGEAGYSGASAALRTELEGYLRERSTAEYVSVFGGGVDAALSVLRAEKALRDYYATEADRETLSDFEAAQGPAIDEIEAKFFEKLETRHNDLRQQARENRGEFFRSLIELGAGTQDAYYNSLSASEQAEMNTLRDALYTAGDGFTAAQKSALAANRSEYQHEFAHRSAQEFIASGLPDQIEQRMVAYYQRTGTPAELALVEQHRSALGRAYAETLQIKAGTRAGYSTQATAALAAVAGSQAKLEAAAETADKDFAEVAGKQTVLLDRYYANHAETDAERQALSGNQRDAGRTNPWAALDWRSDASGAYARADRETQELAAAMILSAKEQEIDINRTLREYQQKQAIAEAMIKFATQRGDDLRKSVYTNYRTYLGQEDVYLQQDYNDYLAGNPPTPKSYEQMNGGQVLDGNTLAVDPNNLFGNANWEDSLTSDLATNGTLVQLGQDTGTPTDDRDIYIKRLNTATNAGTLGSLGGMAGLEYAYNSHLANEYIEAISQLNAAFAGVIRAAGMADERRTDTAEQRLATALAGYNADAAANVNNLNGLLQMQQLAAAEAAANSDSELQSQQGDIQTQYRAQNDVARKYADAARRKQLVGSDLRQYVIDQFQPIANEYQTAQTNVNALAIAGEQLQQDYASATGDQIAAYNDLAQRHQRFQYSNDEFEKRLAIKEYAETPYLYTTGDDEGGTLEEWSASAEQEYERAYQILQTANDRLKQAGYAILEQDQLPEFNALVALYEAGTPPSALTGADVTRMTELLTKKYSDGGGLDATEETELADLKQRQQYMRYSELIAARADHIKHTMRMVRLQKAQQILNGEIEKRRAVVNEKEAAFRSALDNKFPPPSRPVPGKTQEELDNARLSVYARFAQANEAGKTNFADEFQGWYWSGGNWMSQLGVSGAYALAAGQAVAVTPSMITAAIAGSAYASGIPPQDQAAIGLYMASGGLPEYSGFQSIYTNFLMSAMTQDLMAMQYGIVSAIMWPVYSIASAAAIPIQVQIQVLQSSIVLAAAALPLTIIHAALASMAVSAMAQIVSAQLQWHISLLMMASMLFGTLSAGQMSGIEEVRSKQREYDDAQAALNYFTKVSNVDELKDRAQQWGAQHTDPDDGSEALFELTDEDLKYLIENGNMSGLTAEEQTEALDLTAQKDTTKFYDSYGRRYDPNTITTAYPGPVVDGKYGGTHTRITRQLPNGATEYAYALVIPDSDPANEVYSMDSIFDAAVSHGMGLRNLRRDRYESAGANAAATTQDGTFVLNERDATYDYLYDQATERGQGGREFGGYVMTYEDYERNVQNVFEGELQQRQEVQRKEWEYRAAELQSRYDAWERRMTTVLERGAKAWQRSEDRYLQAQRDWERDEDRKAEESQRKWDEAIQAHYTKREQWETEVRNAAATGTISNNLTQAVSGINDQIAQFEASTGLSMPQVDRQAFVNQAIQELQLKQPSLTERFQNVNASIQSFNTTMSLSQMAGTDLTGLSALGAEFRAQVREHQRDMRVYTNARMFEQYQKLEDNFIEQIKRQDKAIEQETRMAALGAGLFESGDVFIKASAVQQGGFGGFVNAYKNFDVEGEVARLKAEQGQSGQSMLEGEALVNFLQGANDVEVEAYFHVAKLQMESVFYKIVGRGNSEERLRSKELADIGTFGVWAGRKPGSEELSGLSQAAAHYGPDKFAHASRNGGELDFLNYANGFGELGALGPRPGGAPMGFYAQLDLLGRLNGQWESKALSDAGYVDPISTTINQFNPIMMTANSIKNIEVGSQVYGRDRGNLIEANLLASVKAPLAAVGSVLVGVGVGLMATGVGAVLGAIVTAVGAIVNIAANSLHVDPTTGKRSMKLTDEAAMQSTIGIAAGAVGGAAASGVISQGAAQGINGALAFASKGVDYDRKGNMTGYSMEGDTLASSAVSAGISGAAGGTGSAVGNALLDHAVSTGVNTAMQYYKYKQGHSNSYLNLTTTGAEGIGALGAAFASGYGSELQEEVIALGRADFGSPGGSPAQQIPTAGLVAGLLAKRREWDWDSFAGEVGGFLSNPFGATFGKGGLWEKGSNFFGESGHWETDAETAYYNNLEGLYADFMTKQTALLQKTGFQSQGELENAILNGQFGRNRTIAQTNDVVQEMANAGMDVSGLVGSLLNARRELFRSGNQAAIARALYGPSGSPGGAAGEPFDARAALERARQQPRQAIIIDKPGQARFVTGPEAERVNAVYMQQQLERLERFEKYTEAHLAGWGEKPTEWERVQYLSGTMSAAEFEARRQAIDSGDPIYRAMKWNGAFNERIWTPQFLTRAQALPYAEQSAALRLAAEEQRGITSSQALHLTMAAGGFIPVIGIGFDAMDTALTAIEWKQGQASGSDVAWSALAMIPLLGDFTGGLIKARRLAKLGHATSAFNLRTAVNALKEMRAAGLVTSAQRRAYLDAAMTDGVEIVTSGKRQVESISDTAFLIVDSQAPRHFRVRAELVDIGRNRNMIKATFALKDDLPGGGIMRSGALRGQTEFDRMVAHFGDSADGFRAEWMAQDNLNAFNDYMRKHVQPGMSNRQIYRTMQDAAKSTWTGQQAVRHGMTEVRIPEARWQPERERFWPVVVDFIKPR